jgi:diguanylate cyclase (GGDEF)-like protein/PAS domain S-box-containing protein
MFINLDQQNMQIEPDRGLHNPVISLYVLIISMIITLGLTAVLFFNYVRVDNERVTARLQRGTDTLIQFVSSPATQDNPMIDAVFGTLARIRSDIPPGREVDQDFLNDYLWETPPQGLETATLEYLPRVSFGERRELSVRFGDQLPDGFSISELHDSKIVPAAPRNDYFPVLYESSRDTAVAVIGMNRGSDPIVRLAMEQARDSGEFTTYNFFPLIGAGKQTGGAHYFLPVYQSGEVPETVAQRRSQLQGFVSVAQYFPEEFAVFFPESYQGVDGAFFPRRNYQDEVKDPELQAGLEQGTVLETPYLLPALNNAPWMAVTRAKPEMIAAVASPTRWWVLSIGVIISIWITMVLVWSRNQAAKVLKLVRSRTRDLAERTETLHEVNDELRTNEARMEHLLSSNPAVLYNLRVEGNEIIPVFHSHSVTRVLGFFGEEILQTDWWPNHVHPEDRDRVQRAMDGMLKKDSLTLNYRLLHKQGHPIYIRDELRIIHDDSGRATEILGAWTDVTGQHVEQERMRMYAAALQNTTDGVLITNLNGEILSANTAFKTISGYSEEELLGRNPRILKSGKQDRLFYQDMWSRLQKEGHWQGEVWNRRKNGEIYPTWLNISQILDVTGAPRHYVAISSDIAQLKHAEFRLEHLAHYDSLTDLPNRLLLQSRLDHAIQQARRRNKQVGLLFIDLDDFKKINDSLGHHVGDQVVKAVSERWRRRLREEDTLGRLGGDEFLLLLENVEASVDAGIVAQDLLETLARPLKLENGQEIFVEASIGISIFPADGKSSEALLRNADTAMYLAKEKGRNQFNFYTSDMGLQAVERMELETALHQGLAQDEFMLYFQPKVDLRTGKMTGAEALLRWNRNRHEIIPPLKFIPIAERSGLIIPIGTWVIKEACRQIRDWLDRGYEPLPVSVNVSAQQFMQPDIGEIIWNYLTEFNLDPRLLGLEITESALMANRKPVIRILEQLKNKGLQLSLDDFGTGFSNLYYLTQFPLDALKIDASFVRKIDTDPNAVTLIRSVIDLADNFHLKTIAEGVETREILAQLKQLGCHEIQGYYFSKPLPAAEFEILLQQQRSLAADGSIYIPEPAVKENTLTSGTFT